MSRNATTACGSRARMPMVITRETPLPMPRSVICSPSHISNIVPVVSTMVVWKRYHQIQESGYITSRPIPSPKICSGLLPSHGHEQTLAQAQQHREIPAVLNDLGPAAFFTSQLAQLRDDRSQQLDNDCGADVGHDAQSADRAVFQRAAREQAVHAKQRRARGLVGGKILGQNLTIQPGNPNHRHQAANGQDQHRENDARLQFGNLEAVTERVGNGG